MYPVSTRFLAALAESHTVVTEVTLFRTDGQVETLEHTGGSVTADRGQAIRRTCTVTLADLSLIPQTAADKLATYGARVRLARGVQFSDGTRELVPLGIFRVDTVTGDPDQGPVTLAGKSLECVVTDDKFTTPYTATGTAVAAITALIQRSVPGASVINRATDAPIGPRTWDIQADPWAAVQEVAAAIGAECYVDADGVFVVAELPDLLTTAPAWTVAAGEGGVLISAKRGMTSDKVHNAVLARGENTQTNTAPVSALVVDSDPSSPTYWDGPFGHRPDFYSSSTLTTTAACTAAATLKLRAAKAPNASGDLSALPNPAVEPGDVLRVVYIDGTRELHQVQGLTIPLDEGGDAPITTISAKEDR
ncbi:DUF5047 domain-containing protein [Streptomyces ehimensis]|uniref:DUF5047 domain-containing protein n=1 Tax=Streptomyces ehimensis TaxID=68195 RepID=A0ABV9BES5_9ACTN